MLICRRNQKSTFVPTRRPVIILVIVLLAAFFCFYNLGGRSISRADESLYVRSVQEMFQNGSWIPTLHGTPFLHKPPLSQYLMSFSVYAFGHETWAYRLPSAIAGFLFILIIPIFAYRMFQSALISALSFAAILSCKMLFSSHLIREATTDGILLLWLLIGLLLGWELGRELKVTPSTSRRTLLLSALFGFSVLMALLSKSVAGLMSLAVWWVWMLLFGRSGIQPINRFLIVIALTTLLPAILFSVGYFLLLQSVPGTFTAALHYEVLEKLFGAGHHNTSLPYYYFSQLFKHERAFPALTLLLALVFGTVKAARGDARFAYLIISIVLPLFGYTALHSRLYWYIAPIFASTAILIGYGLATCYRTATDASQGRTHRWGAIICGVLLAVLLMRNLVDVVRKQILPTKIIGLEQQVRKLIIKKNNDSRLRIIRLCINPDDEYFKSLMLREWFYLDLLKPLSTDLCSPSDLQTELRIDAPKAIVTPPRFEDMLRGTTARITERSPVRLDRWKGAANPNRARELLFLRIEW